MTQLHPEAVVSIKTIREAAQRAWADHGDAAVKPYPRPDHREPHDTTACRYTEWENAFARARASDELAGSEA